MDTVLLVVVSLFVGLAIFVLREGLSTSDEDIDEEI